MMKSLHYEVFAIAIAVAKRCFNGENPLHDNRFPASGTDFSLPDDQKQLIVRFSEWPPAVFRTYFQKTAIENGFPYGGSSLDDEVFRPLGYIEPVFNAFQLFFFFHLTTISLNSDFNGTDYRHQAGHHSILDSD